MKEREKETSSPTEADERQPLLNDSQNTSENAEQATDTVKRYSYNTWDLCKHSLVHTSG
jgi:hypothetical protein